ncbi:MAG: hypothetical protein JSS42_00135 [Proteobacteria bacterium]|uniref:DUF4097 family beta strand repeat-containing protein n=1 Tax=Rudaea sp. TaxID=2136325 RepID=UPI00321FE120|nr:hypothetical protein [Pseudomonadota bacterium]
MRLILIPLLLVSPFAAAGECQFSAERNLDIDSAGLQALRMQLGSSDLNLQGDPAATRIEVRGKACASEQAWLDELQIEQSRQGGKAVVKTAPHPTHVGVFGKHYAYIDFVVRVPANLAIEVESGSGDTHAANIASLDYHAGSGDLNLDHAAGAVSVTVGSGDVVASHVGSFKLGNAGSGDMHVSDVQGDATIGHVGSGDLSFSDVRGSLRADSIGSGDVVAERIGRDVFIGSIGSGDVTAKTVGGGLTVRSAGSGDIHHSGVVGKVEVPKRHEND